jgi:hydroxymethylpyrimidine/phosphomethylpyrimidine kinase
MRRRSYRANNAVASTIATQSLPDRPHVPPARPLPPIVLAFAGADPTGGAGLQADLLTLAALGCHPLSVVTAITAQDTTGVAGVQPVSAEWVARQARTVLADLPVRAIKVGMVATAENAAAIAAVIDEHPGIPVVLDPVLASGRGDPLGTGDAAAALADLLVPRATVVTPNTPEVRRLAAAAGEEADALPLDRCAGRLVARGAKFVLVTGTHEPTGEVVNTLYDAGGVVRSDRWERLPGAYHGSGCTLASALAAGLAHGLAVPDAVRAAQEFTWQALADGFRPGAGQAIPDRLYRLRTAAAEAALE